MLENSKKESENTQENFSNPTEDSVEQWLRSGNDRNKKKRNKFIFLASLLIISALTDKIFLILLFVKNYIQFVQIIDIQNVKYLERVNGVTNV